MSENDGIHDYVVCQTCKHGRNHCDTCGRPESDADHITTSVDNLLAHLTGPYHRVTCDCHDMNVVILQRLKGKDA